MKFFIIEINEEEEEIEIVDSSLQLVTTYDHFLKSEEIPKRKHPQPSQLPETITVLHDQTTNGTIYLVGTAHFRFSFSFYSIYLLKLNI